jgi:hypothetical protein
MFTKSSAIIASAEATFTRKTLLLQKILEVVDDAKVQGIIFGSVVHKWLSQIDYSTNDLDILFPSIEAMTMFQTMMGGEAPYKSDDLYWARSYRTYSYTFSEYITNKYTDTANRLQYSSFMMNYTMKSTRDRIIVHGMVLNMSKFSTTDQQRLQKRDIETASLLSEKVLTKDFLCNMYMSGNIYHKLKDVTIVELNTFTRTHKMDKIICKYTFRGVKFTLVDGSAMVAPSKEQLTVAKDEYRSKGLVVIPLSRKDNDMAGKAPSVANWSALSSAYNFTVRGTTANIGILCGPASGIVCIDVDVKDRGVEMFNKMMQKYGYLTCPTQRTGSGGYHFIFKYNPTRMTNMMAKIKCPKLHGASIGVDMWIQQCQFVAAPSVNYSTGKSYKWTTPITTADAIPDMPEWIYQLYELETIDDQGLIIGATVQPQETEPKPTTIQEPIADTTVGMAVPIVEAYEGFNDSESTYRDCDIQSDHDESECTDEPIHHAYDIHADRMNVDLAYTFGYKSMEFALQHPEYAIAGLIVLLMFMAMFGFVLFLLLILACIYHKQLMPIIMKQMRND